MDDMTIIDATAKLKTTDFNKFRKLLKDDDIILAQVSVANPSEHNVDSEYILNVDNFRTFFEDKHQFDDNDIINFCTENVMLTTTGAWYKKWCQPSWSICIFPEKTSSTTKSKKEDTLTVISVKLRYKDDEENVQEFSGTKSKCIDWLNQTAPIMQIQSFFEREVEYNINDAGWKTYEELLKEGVIE